MGEIEYDVTAVMMEIAFFDAPLYPDECRMLLPYMVTLGAYTHKQ